MVELVDKHDSESCVRNDVGVRVSPTAPGSSFVTVVVEDQVILQKPRFKGPDSSVGRATD